MNLEKEETRVLRICDLWYVFQHHDVVYPKFVYIFEEINNSLVCVDNFLFGEWYFEWDNTNRDYEIIEINFGGNCGSYISCVRGKFNG